MYYVTLDDGKYKFLIDDRGLMAAAYRNEQLWEAGYEMRFSQCFMAALWRIHELETSEKS